MALRRSPIAILAALAFVVSPAGYASAQDDHGDAFDAATSLLPDETVRGRIDCRGDVDVFSLITCGGAGYTVRARIWPRGQAILDILAADGRTLIASDCDDEGTETLEISWTARASATNYVSLRALRYDDSGGAFEVTLTTLRGLSVSVPPLIATRTNGGGSERPRDATSRNGDADAASAARERREAEREQRILRARERREQTRRESEARRADRELRRMSEVVRRRGSQQSPDEPAGMGRAWRCTGCGAYTRNSRECPECRRRGLGP